jgi:hypothetical protein
VRLCAPIGAGYGTIEIVLVALVVEQVTTARLAIACAAAAGRLTNEWT